jgi:hypothetical protein
VKGHLLYCALITTPLLVGGVLLGLFVHPLAGAVYLIVFYVAYTRYNWLHLTADRISKGIGKGKSGERSASRTASRHP